MPFLLLLEGLHITPHKTKATVVIFSTGFSPLLRLLPLLLALSSRCIQYREIKKAQNLSDLHTG